MDIDILIVPVCKFTFNRISQVARTYKLPHVMCGACNLSLNYIWVNTCMWIGFSAYELQLSTVQATKHMRSYPLGLAFPSELETDNVTVHTN